MPLFVNPNIRKILYMKKTDANLKTLLELKRSIVFTRFSNKSRIYQKDILTFRVLWRARVLRVIRYLHVVATSEGGKKQLYLASWSGRLTGSPPGFCAEAPLHVAPFWVEDMRRIYAGTQR